MVAFAGSDFPPRCRRDAFTKRVLVQRQITTIYKKKQPQPANTGHPPKLAPGVVKDDSEPRGPEGLPPPYVAVSADRGLRCR